MMISKLGESGSLNPLRTLNLLKLTPRVGLLFKEIHGRILGGGGDGVRPPTHGFSNFCEKVEKRGDFSQIIQPPNFLYYEI